MVLQERKPAQRGRDGKVWILAAAILVLVLMGLCWGLGALYRGGAFQRAGGMASSSPLPVQMATPLGSPTVSRLATKTPVALEATRPPTLAPLEPRETWPTPTSMPTTAPLPSPTPDPLSGTYVVEYLGCVKHGSGTGTVKGRVFDRTGDIVVGADVRVTLNGWTYDLPGITNSAGWYEFYLDKGLKVKIASLRVNGQDMPLAGHTDLEFTSQGGCFEHVNLRQR